MKTTNPGPVPGFAFILKINPLTPVSTIRENYGSFNFPFMYILLQTNCHVLLPGARVILPAVARMP